MHTYISWGVFVVVQGECSMIFCAQGLCSHDDLSASIVALAVSGPGLCNLTSYIC